MTWPPNNGILGKVPGALIAEAQQQHGPPGSSSPREVASEIDVPEVGRVRIKIQLKKSHHHRSTNWYWNAYFAELVDGGCDG